MITPRSFSCCFFISREVSQQKVLCLWSLTRCTFEKESLQRDRVYVPSWQPRQIDTQTPIKVAPWSATNERVAYFIFIYTVWGRLASVLMQTKQGTGERIVCCGFVWCVRRTSNSPCGSFVARPETMEGPIYKMHVVNWLLSGAKTRPLFCAQ
jgi:hypothetical protein